MRAICASPERRFEMPTVRIDGRQITNWRTFHNVFSKAFGFPGFYGRNMDAWIDCLTSVDDPDSGMTKVFATSSDPVVLQIDHVDYIRRRDEKIYEAIVECSAFVNWRRMDVGEPPILMLSFYSDLRVAGRVDDQGCPRADVASQRNRFDRPWVPGAGRELHVQVVVVAVADVWDSLCVE